MSLQVVWESRWALPGDHISAADVRCRIPLCFLPWKTPSTSRLDPLHHGHIAACHNAVQEQQPLKSQPQTCSGLFSFSLAGKRQKKKICGCKEYLTQQQFPGDRAKKVPPSRNFQVCHPCAMAQVWLGAHTAARLPQPWSLSSLDIPRN